MPKSPRFIHPIRKIRTVLQRTQTQFAELIGVSAIALKRIENGSLKLSPQLASRIAAATGALPAELLKGRKGKALGANEEPYTAESYERWTAMWIRSDPAMIEDLGSQLSDFIRLVLAAAVTDDPRRLRGVCVALANAVSQVSADFELDEVVTRLWEETAVETLPRGNSGDNYSRVDVKLWPLIRDLYMRLGKPSPVVDPDFPDSLP